MSQPIPLKALRGVPVVTRSGDRIGRLLDVEIDPETQLAVTFVVRPSPIAATLVRASLRIARSQVVAITPAQVVVEDAVRREPIESRASRAPLTKDVSPALPTERG